MGFQETRDTFSGQTTQLFGIERDADGAPVAPVTPEFPEAPNPMVTMLIERALEVGAAVLFLFLLLRTLKRSKALDKQRALELEAEAKRLQARTGELDPSLVGRRTVEHLIDQDPERVSALLSRWAVGEEVYEQSAKTRP